MRALITACLLLAATVATAAASQAPVVVTTQDGRQIEGRLLALTLERLTLSRDGRLEQLPLDTVIRVVRPRDGIGDGILKGFLIGFLPVLIVSGEIRAAVQAGAGYGLIGGSIDALQGETIVLYDRHATVQPPARPSVGWTIRF